VRRLFNLHDNVQGQLHDNQREEDDVREAGVAKSQRKVEARNREARKGGTGD
jgi:hypothetical protein